MDAYQPLVAGSKIVTVTSAPNEAFFSTGAHQAITELIALGALPATTGLTALPASGSAGQIVYIEDTGTAAGLAPNGDTVLSRWDASLTIPAWVSMLGVANDQWSKFYIAALGATPSQTITFTQVAPSTTWSIAHNFGARPIVQVWDATFANLLAPTNIAHPTVNSTVISFGSAVAGNAILVVTTTSGVSAGSPFAGMTSN